MIASAVFLPLFGSFLAGILVFIKIFDENKKTYLLIDRISQYLTCLGLLISAVLSILIFKDVALGGNEQTVQLFRWIDSGNLNISFIS